MGFPEVFRSASVSGFGAYFFGLDGRTACVAIGYLAATASGTAAGVAWLTCAAA